MDRRPRRAHQARASRDMMACVRAATLISAPYPHRRHGRRRTQERSMTQPATTADVQIRVVDGQECTDRVGIALLAGWKPGNSVNVRAKTDPEFPQPIRAQRIDKSFWYPLEGDHGVLSYLEVLAERANALKPPQVKDGDDDDMLGPDEVADALHVTPGTFRFYVHRSKPFWPEPFGQGRTDRQPILPAPDLEEERTEDATGRTYTHREWRRGTLKAHQDNRPGKGNRIGPAHKSTTGR